MAHSQTQTDLHNMFDRYRLEQKLGQGGMGVVYKVWDNILNRSVALKILLDNFDNDKRQNIRLIQEAKSMARLNHPNIIAIYDIGEHPKIHFTMEYIKGKSLAELVAKTPMKSKEAAQLILKCANGLHYAHKEKIIHRDIKPANIMIDENKEPKIMDFGLAKQMDAQIGVSKSGDLLGTPAYMSPEQADNKQIDARSDIYSLGATLYQVLTARPPFTGQSYFNIMLQISQKDPIAPRQLYPSISKDLEAICLKCLEKKPQKRYSHARDLALDLKNFLNNRPVLAKPPSKLTQAKKFLARNTFACSVIFIFLVTLIGAITNHMRQQKKYIQKQNEQMEKIKKTLERAERAEKKNVQVRLKLEKALQQAKTAEKNMQKLCKATNESLKYIVKKGYMGNDSQCLIPIKQVLQEIGKEEMDKDTYYYFLELITLHFPGIRTEEKSRDIEQSIMDYTFLLKSRPNAKIYNNRGRAYFFLENYDMAIADFDMAIKMNPNNVEYYNNRGMTYTRLGKMNSAFQDYDQAINLKPNFATTYNFRGNAFYKLKQYNLAIKDYSQAIRLKIMPRAAVYGNRGAAYCELGQYRRAIQDLEKAILLDERSKSRTMPIIERARRELRK